LTQYVKNIKAQSKQNKDSGPRKIYYFLKKTVFYFKNNSNVICRFGKSRTVCIVLKLQAAIFGFTPQALKAKFEKKSTSPQ
jgi:hypothetical protein